VENAADVGTIKALADKKGREEGWDLAKLIQFIELADDPDFAIGYPMAITFPSPDHLQDCLEESPSSHNDFFQSDNL